MMWIPAEKSLNNNKKLLQTLIEGNDPDKIPGDVVISSLMCLVPKLFIKTRMPCQEDLAKIGTGLRKRMRPCAE